MGHPAGSGPRRAAIQSLQGLPHLLEQLCEGSGQDNRPADEHYVDACLQAVLLAAIRLPHPPPRPVAVDRAAHPAAHREPNPTPSILVSPERDEARPLVALAQLKDRLDFRGPLEPLAPRKG